MDDRKPALVSPLTQNSKEIVSCLAPPSPRHAFAWNGKRRIGSWSKFDRPIFGISGANTRFEKITIPPIDISANLFHDPRVFDSSFPFRRMERGVNNRRGQAIDRAEWKENPSIKRVYIYIYSNNSRMLICEFSRIHLRNRKIWRNNKTIRGIGQLEAWWLSIDESFFSTSRFQGLTQGCTIDAVPRTNRRLYTLPYPWSVTVFVPSLLEPWIPLEPR